MSKEHFSVLDRELDYRRTAGIVVRLMLKGGKGSDIYVDYQHGEDSFQADIPPEKAYHAFYHPNLYRVDDAPQRQSIYAAPEGYEGGSA